MQYFTKVNYRRRVDVKKLVYIALAVIVLLFLVIGIRNLTMLVKAPKEGTKEPRYFSRDSITEDGNLQVVGAKPSKSTDPGKYGVTSYLTLEGIPLDGYYRFENVSFTPNADNASEDALTFRGNALRNKGCFGLMSVTKGSFGKTWRVALKPSIAIGKNLESRCQPLVISWSKDKMAYLNLLETKKRKESLVEVIYTDLSGQISFYDLEDGNNTRKAINIDVPISGTASICPDGTPLLVVAGGASSDKEVSKIVIINLYTGEIVKEAGDRFNYAENPPEEHYNFSSSALYSFNGDCLVYQGENGVVYSYTVKKSLAAGELSVEFNQELKFTYSVNTDKGSSFGHTLSSGPAAYGDYLFSGDELGNLACFNVSSQKLVWIRNLGDNILSSPVIEEDKNTGHVYVYIGTALVENGEKKTEDSAYMYKINAANGEIIWQRKEEVGYSKKVNGGVVGTPLLGDRNLNGNIYFTISGVDGTRSGRLVCLDKETGEQKYYVRFKNYIYSSPVAAYKASGDGFVIVCDNKGNIFSLEGKTGENINTKKVGERITADPVVYNNKLIVASEEGIYGIEIE